MAYINHRGMNTVSRFWAKVDIRSKEECWPWIACLTKGYGTFRLGQGLKNGRSNRIAWIFTHGEIPEGMNVLHKCDNPKCCNPSHMFLGTHADNVEDMISKNRNSYGENSGLSKLTNAEALEIKNLKPEKPHTLGNGKLAQTLAEKYGMRADNIYFIWRGDTWKHV